MPGADAHSCDCSPGFKGRRCELGKWGHSPSLPGRETATAAGCEASGPGTSKCGAMPGAGASGADLRVPESGAGGQ